MDWAVLDGTEAAHLCAAAPVTELWIVGWSVMYSVSSELVAAAADPVPSEKLCQRWILLLHAPQVMEELAFVGCC